MTKTIDDRQILILLQYNLKWLNIIIQLHFLQVYLNEVSYPSLLE